MRPQTGFCDSKRAFAAVANSLHQYVRSGEKESTVFIRGFNLVDLAKNATFIELPEEKELEDWNAKVMHHTYVHEDLSRLLKTFRFDGLDLRYDVHPMGMFISAVQALGTFYPDSNPALRGPGFLRQNPENRNKQVFRILGKVPTIAACCYRHRIGRPYNLPQNHLSYAENFLHMLDSLGDSQYKPHPILTRALDKMFILNIESGFTPCAVVVRVALLTAPALASCGTDPYTAIASAASAVYGPLHEEGAEVLRTLQAIKDQAGIPAYLKKVVEEESHIPGFRVWRGTYDPRVAVLKDIAKDVFELLSAPSTAVLAAQLEDAIAKHPDPYFRHLRPTFDFYSCLIYKAMGFPPDMLPVLYAVPRTAGWLAHWVESTQGKIVVPRLDASYVGPKNRPWVDLEDRKAAPATNLRAASAGSGLRRNLSRSALLSSQQ